MRSDWSGWLLWIARMVFVQRTKALQYGTVCVSADLSSEQVGIINRSEVECTVATISAIILPNAMDRGGRLH